MSRPNKPRSIGNEANLAERIAWERRKRELSYESLAKVMTAAGCAITGSAIFKIEKGNPPRRITVDELVTLAKVFDVSVDNLLTPTELLNQQRARQLVQQIDRADQEWMLAVSKAIDNYTEFYMLSLEDLELADYIEGHRWNIDELDDEFSQMLGGLLSDGAPDQGDGPFRDALKEFWIRIRNEAWARVVVSKPNEWARQREQLKSGEVSSTQFALCADCAGTSHDASNHVHR